MKNVLRFAMIVVTVLMAVNTVSAQNQKPEFPAGYQVDTRIDNMGYWQRCAQAGLTPVQPFAPIPPARYNGSKVLMRGVRVIDSPDVCVTNEPSNSTQSENSIVVNPNNEVILLNSNNSTPQPSNGTVKGADALHSTDGGETWGGTVEGAGGPNSGDPAAVIDLNGRWFIGFIDNANGQSVAYSDNQGTNWSVSKVANGTMLNLLDKNHLWVDISPVSPFKNQLYNGWMQSNNIYVSRSVTSGTSWSTPVNISSATAAGSHNQGINFKCGPDGEVYAAWSVYDNWPGDEKAIGFSKSLDGGATWSTAVRAINNTKGIRTTGVSQNMRVNSFPCMTVDLSNGPNRGNIYVVWTNIGTPGINSGTGSSVWLIKSTDQGATWSAPKRVNSDSTAGKHHYLPWIACDPTNGYLSVVFYDNRNCGSAEAEAWMAYSTDGGETFTDLKVSDVTFTPAPIPNMASKYMGDYLAIDAYGGVAYPCWTDTRSGHCLTYVSPIEIIVPQSSVAYVEYILNDVTFGNGNGMMDYGETILLSLKMKNIGNAPADSVTVYLSTENPHVTILDGEEFYGHFEVDQEFAITDAYKFVVSDSIANMEQVFFTVKAVDKKDSITWSSFYIHSHAPDVSILDLTIDDPLPGGNGNGRLDPGETATLMIETANLSIWDAEEVVSNLTSLNPYVKLGNGTVNIGTLEAGQTLQVTFPVTVAPTAAIGSAARLFNLATSKYRVTEKFFNAKIGLIVEDWETGNFSKFAWEFTDPSKPWTIDPVIRYEGNYSARSGVITHGESTGIFIDYNCALDDSISFFKRVSSQMIRDNLRFYIDDAMVGIWSNKTDTLFRRVAFPVMAGPHTFKWVYDKDASGTVGLDAAWIDFIVFPPQYLTTADAGGNAEICGAQDYQLHGLANDYDSLLWITGGDGSFSDPHLLDPVYTPGPGDVSTGSVVLTLSAYGETTVSSGMTLTIARLPEASAGTDGAVCAGSKFTLAQSVVANASQLQWSSTGDGSFDDPAALHPVYTPGPQDTGIGSAMLRLTASGNNACPAASDSVLLTINANPVINIGQDSVLCAGQSIVLNATIPNGTSYLWLPSNKTTPSITVDSTGIGLNTRKISVVVTDANQCQGNDSVMIGFKVCGGMGELQDVSVNVFPNPGSGLFSLEIKSLRNIQSDLTILNAAGESVYSIREFYSSGTTVNQLDLRNLPAGTYLLKLSAPSGSLTRKLVISR